MIERKEEISLAMFGVVAPEDDSAMMITQEQRQVSSSEDLGTSGFDEEHVELEQFVQSVPKIELHVHLDGSFEPAQMWSHLLEDPKLLQCFPVEKKLPWAKRSEPPLPLREMIENCQSPLDYRQLCTCRRRYRSLRHSDEPKPPRGKSPQGTLEDMLTCFEFFFPLVYDNLELLEKLAVDFVTRQYEQNVLYTEVRYSPHLLAKDPRKAHQAITQGLRKGCEQYKIIINQILCGIDFSSEWANDVVEMADNHRRDFPCAVVGVDIAAGEGHFSEDSPHRLAHYEMCQKAKELGLNITLHAGETPDSASNVEKAINDYGAVRIGHAYHITNHPEIMDLVKEKKVHLEVCPTSSVETGGWNKTDWMDHPACIFRDNGVSMSLSSDDPAVFNTSLTWQYRIALKKMRWDKEDILEMLEDAINATFLPEDKKASLRKAIRDFSVGENLAFTDRVHYD